MAAQAEIAHLLPGRLRLRVAEHKGDRDFFERLQTSLAGCPGVSDLRVNPHTGSVLIQHESTLGEIMEYARNNDLLVAAPAAPNPILVAPTDMALQALLSFDSRLREGTSGNWNLRELAFFLLSVTALIQAVRQNFLPAGGTLLWYAVVLLQQKFKQDELQM